VPQQFHRDRVTASRVFSVQAWYYNRDVMLHIYIVMFVGSMEELYRRDKIYRVAWSVNA